jgi:hypothetical protein
LPTLWDRDGCTLLEPEEFIREWPPAAPKRSGKPRRKNVATALRHGQAKVIACSLTILNYGRKIKD